MPDRALGTLCYRPTRVIRPGASHDAMSFPELQSVLFVEDDSDTQAAVRFALETLHQVHLRVCSSAREALLAAAEFPASLLLLDVMMPEIDGVSVLAGLRQNELHHQTPAIFLTSLVDEENLRYYSSLGVAGVIAKPFDPLTLGERIVELLRVERGRIAPLPVLNEELRSLQQVFERELPARLARIRELVARGTSGPVTRADCARLWELLEDLRNAATSYGHQRIAQDALGAEQAAASLVLASERSVDDFLRIERRLLDWNA